MYTHSTRAQLHVYMLSRVWMYMHVNICHAYVHTYVNICITRIETCVHVYTDMLLIPFKTVTVKLQKQNQKLTQNHRKIG